MGPLGVLCHTVVPADEVMQCPHRQKGCPALPELWDTTRSQLGTGGGGDAGQQVCPMLLYCLVLNTMNALLEDQGFPCLEQGQAV